MNNLVVYLKSIKIFLLIYFFWMVFMFIMTLLGIHMIYGSNEYSHFSTLVNQWDAGWYRSIAIGGYHWNGEVYKQQNVAFFPLYPIITGTIYKLTGHLTLIEFLVSELFGFLSFIVFNSILSKLNVSNRKRMVLSIAFAIFPISIYSMLGYPTSLINFLSFLSIKLALDKRVNIALIVSGILTSAAPLGIAVTLGIIVYNLLFCDYIKLTVKSVLKLLLMILIGTFGLIAFITYLYFHFQSPFAFISVQVAWHGSISLIAKLSRLFLMTPVINSFNWFINNPTQPGFSIMIDGLFILLALLTLIYYLWNRLELISIVFVLGLVITFYFQCVEFNDGVSFTRIFAPFTLLSYINLINFRISKWVYSFVFLLFIIIDVIWIIFLLKGWWVE